MACLGCEETGLEQRQGREPLIKTQRVSKSKEHAGRPSYADAVVRNGDGGLVL